MTALLFGATSDIAIALAKCLAKNKYNLQLAGRDMEVMTGLKNNIEIQQQVRVSVYEFDAEKFDEHAAWYDQLQPKPDIVILVFGYLGNHQKAIEDWKESKRILDTNYVGAVSILNIVANDFANRKQGVIVGISSVAGDRGRMSNYLYGSAKAGLTAYLSGLRNRLYHSGVHVLTVMPGFVRTQMTEGLKLPPLVTAEPDQVAQKIVNAIEGKRNTLYVLPIWRLIMLVIRNIPEFIFKKLKL